MTCREKLAKEHPECIDSSTLGGCIGCPSDYGYRKRAEWCHDTRYPKHERCTRCWDRVCGHVHETGSLKQAMKAYAERCELSTINKSREVLKIKNVIFNDPATIVFWADGTKTVVKCQDGDVFDPEKGLAIAISKKALGNKSNFNNEFKKWLLEEEKEELTSAERLQRGLKAMGEAMADLQIPVLRINYGSGIGVRRDRREDRRE